MSTDGSEKVYAHWLDVSALGPSGKHFRITLETDELEAVRKELNLIALDSLQAEGRVWPLDDGATVDFQLTARAEQACVVTLDPVPCDVDERVSLQYTPTTCAPATPSDIDIDEDDDPPEPMVDGRIDIGAAMVEHLVLGLDPWPRKAGVSVEDLEHGKADARESPFAVLAGLKAELKDKKSDS